MKKSAASIIRAKPQARKKVTRRLAPKIKASHVGVAFLTAQITDLEERCAAMRNGINNNGQEEPRGERSPRERPVTLKRNQIRN